MAGAGAALDAGGKIKDPAGGFVFIAFLFAALQVPK